MSNKVEAATGGRWNAIAAEARANWSPQAHEIADKLGDQLDAEVANYVTPSPPPAEPPLAAARRTNTFTDSDGDTFKASEGGVEDWETIDLWATHKDGDITTLTFFKADATKIIALIAEAAK